MLRKKRIEVFFPPVVGHWICSIAPGAFGERRHKTIINVDFEPTMAMIAMCMPILPGKKEMWLEMIKQVTGPGRRFARP